MKVLVGFSKLAEVMEFFLGPCLFLVLVVGGYVAVVKEWHGLTIGDYLGAIGAGSGLLAVGHGIHHASRTRTPPGS
jgi:hypothetical protein